MRTGAPNSSKTLFLSTLRADALESRLKKYNFLTKSSLPGYPDALVFQMLQAFVSKNGTTQGILNRSDYPSLYHWYIIMKQFAQATLEKWIEAGTQNEDALIEEIRSRFEETSLKLAKDQPGVIKDDLSTSTRHKTPEQQNDLNITKNKQQGETYRTQLLKSLSYPRTPENKEPQFVMDIKLKSDIKWEIETLKNKLKKEVSRLGLSKANLSRIILMDDGTHNLELCLHLKIEADRLEEIKQRIIKLAQVEKVEVRRQKRKLSQDVKEGSRYFNE